MRAAVAIFAVVILVGAVPVALSSTLEQSATGQTITNETFTPTGGTVTTLNESNRADVLYNESVTVYNDTDVRMTDGNYTWFATNGTLKTTAGSQLADDPSGNVTYGYLDTTEDHLTLTAVFSTIPDAVGIALPILVAVVFIRALVGGV